MPLRVGNPIAEFSASKSKQQKGGAKLAENSLAHEPTTQQKTQAKKQKNHLKNDAIDTTAIIYGAIIFLLGFLVSALIIQFMPTAKNVEVEMKTAEIFNEALEAAISANDNNTAESTTNEQTKAGVRRPTFAMYTFRKNQDNLSVIRKILKLFGYTEVGLDDDWNLLWGFESPFPDYRETVKKIKSHQVVNHMPGMNFIAHKVEISTSGSPHMPPAFKLPSEKEKFLSYAAKHPDKLFVEKSNSHRHVAIKKPQDINLESNSTFVQEFLMNPYLVDGFKFDIGVYTVITSVDPLRLYIYTGDVMFRYCQEKFHPFNSSVLEKYVVGDKYRPTWKVPTLKKYFTRFGGGMRASFDAYVRDKGQDPSIIWQRAEEVIRHTVLSQATNIAATFRAYPVQNFFEIIRVDMIIDTDLKVHLIEINLSPNMHSHKFLHNNVVFEQVLYNALRLTGVGNPIKEQEGVTNFGKILNAVTADKSVASNLNDCVAYDCNHTCDEELACSLCITCMDEDDYTFFANTQREHLHRGDMRRIFPKAIDNVQNYDLEAETQNMTIANKVLAKWFYHKCLYDRSWCQ